MRPGHLPSALIEEERSRIPASALDDAPIRRTYPAARNDEVMVNQQSGLDGLQCRLGPLNSIDDRAYSAFHQSPEGHIRSPALFVSAWRSQHLG